MKGDQFGWECFAFTCTHCGARLKARLAHRGTPGQCPRCRKVVEIPERAEPLKPSLAIPFFGIPLALAGVVIGLTIKLAVFGGQPGVGTATWIACIVLGAIGGSWLGWLYARREGLLLRDYVLHGDMFASLVMSYNNDPRLLAVPAGTIPEDPAQPAKMPPEPEYGFTPGRWANWGCMLTGLVGFVGGGVGGLLASLLGGQQRGEVIAGILGGGFGGFFVLGFVGWVIGVVSGTLRDLSQRRSQPNGSGDPGV